MLLDLERPVTPSAEPVLFDAEVLPFKGPLAGVGDAKPIFVIADEALDRMDRLQLASALESGSDDLKVAFLSDAFMKRHRTINGVARQFMKDMASLCSNEAIRIVGFGRSGFIAYELAHMWHAAGRKVEFLGLVDTRLSDILEAPQSEASDEISEDYVLEAPSLRITWLSRKSKVADEEAAAWQAFWGRTGGAVHLLDPENQLGAGEATSYPREVGETLRICLATEPEANLNSKESAYRPMMTLQSGARGQVPYICVPGAGASVVDFLPLTESLGRETPVYALQPRGMDGVLAPYPDVEAAVEAYLPHVVEQCGQRNHVHLVGHSFGGWVALAMAQRLAVEGIAVDSLTILDSEAPAGFGRLGAEYTRPEALGELVELLEMAAERSTGLSVDHFRGRTVSEQLSLLHRRMVAIGLMPARSNPKQLLGTVRSFEAALRTAFAPEAPYQGVVRVVFVRSVGEAREKTEARIHAAAHAWKAWVPNAEFRLGSGNHVTLLKSPHVAGVAQWLRGDASELVAISSFSSEVTPAAADVQKRVAGASF